MDSDSQKLDEHEKYFETPPSVSAVTEEAEAAEPHTPKKRPFVSKGEHIHKWSSYFGIDWFFNTFSGVTFAYWANFTKTGQKFWSGPITRSLDKIFTPLIKNDERRAGSVAKGNMFMGIVTGGMFTIPPLLILESKKVKLAIVKSLDRLIYGKDKVENDPKFQETYKEIEEAPKKNFGIGMLARATALSPLIASILIPAARKYSDKYYYQPVEQGFSSISKKIGLGPEKTFKKAPSDGVLLVNGEKAQPWKWVQESIAMDFGMGVLYAVMHAFFYNRFATAWAAHKEKKHPSTETPAQNLQPRPAAKEASVPEKPATSPEIHTAKQDKDTPSPQVSHVEAMPMPADLSAGQLQQSPSP